jgi:ADP-heptose:LPS heptosyltransferase
MKQDRTYLKTRTLFSTLALFGALGTPTVGLVHAKVASLLPISFNPKSIVLATCNPFLGDSLLFVFPQLEILRKRYPDAKVTLVSSVKFIKEQSWLKVISPKKESFDSIVENEFDAETLLVSTSTDLRLLSAGCEEADPSLPLKLPASVYQERYDQLVDKIAAKKSSLLEPTETFLTPRKAFRFTRNGITRTFLPTDDDGKMTNGNRYVRSENMMEFLYGVETEWKINPTLFMNDAERALFDQFHSTSFANKNPYVVLNFGTFGMRKVTVLTVFGPKYFEEMADQILKRELNLYLVPFEPNTAPYFKDSIARIIAKYPGRVRLLDETQKSTWDAAIEKAEAVLSYDSGFTHVSNAILPSHRVLTYHINSRVESFASPFVQKRMTELYPPEFIEKLNATNTLKSITMGGSAQGWRKPDQSYIVFKEYEENDEWKAQVDTWLDRALKDCDSDLRKQRSAAAL